ncbi:MAG: prolyl oligopeptidase family serine peptidase [Planctomycetaceae bacterium]
MSRWLDALAVGLVVCLGDLGARAVSPARGEELPGTARIDWPEADLSGRLMDGAHRFIDQKIADSEAQRGRAWSRDFSSPEAYARSVAPNRERFRTIIGAVDDRPPPAMERYGVDVDQPLVAETAAFTVWQVRWPVVDGVWGCGLLVEPRGTPRGHVVLVPDSEEVPEGCVGLHGACSVRDDKAPDRAPAARLAASGFTVIVPVTVSREKLITDDAQLAKSDQTYREWIYRQAYHMGRHVIGYEVQTVLAAVDWLEAIHGPGAMIGVCGRGDGGLTALYAAAVDTRIDAVLVSDSFDSRQDVWREPIDRNVWGLLREFGDAEIAGLVLPRGLVIECLARSEPSSDREPGQAVGAAAGEPADFPPGKGVRRPPHLDTVMREIARVELGGTLAAPTIVVSETGPLSETALEGFITLLGAHELRPWGGETLADRRESFDPAARHLRYVKEIEGHVQRLVRQADKTRDDGFLFTVMPELAGGKWSTDRRHPTHDAATFIEGARAYRERFHAEAMGRFDDPLMAPNARSRIVAESDAWTAYDVVLDVYPGFFAWGVLVLPKNLEPGERRPVVVCQHGRNGVPLDLVNTNNPAYSNAAAVLAERGFVTFAPHNLYRGEDRYRWLCRKANNVGTTLFSFIIASHDQITRWLAAQPFVDPERIAFYGLSYGGETAVRVPPILERYCLSICSGDFNQWTRKVAATDEAFSFMRTIEWEMPYWNLGRTFDYAEMSYLMVPRPFMVERGHHDLVGRDPWVAHEYAKVRWLYAQLGLADRTEIEFFQGGHSMNLQRSVAFLHKHLRWPEP